MFDNWLELKSCLGSAFPHANVNLLYDDNVDGPRNENLAKALEMRPNSRTFWKNTVLPAKWSVTVADNQHGILYVSINKIEKQVFEKTEFSYQQIQEIVDFLMCHPFITCQWTYCKGIPSSDLVPSINHLTIDHFGGMCIWRSVDCKLLMAKEECTTDRCSYCSNATVTKEAISSLETQKIDESASVVDGDQGLSYEIAEEEIHNSNSNGNCDDQKIPVNGVEINGIELNISHKREMKRKSKTNHKWKCSFCNEELRTNALLRRHNSEAHSDHPRFKFTTFYLKKVSSFEAGVDMHAKNTVLRCSAKNKPSRNCQRPFYSVGNWIRHMQVHSGEPGLHIPDLQEYKNLWKEFLKQRACEDWKSKYKQRMGKFICDLCGAVMSYPARFKHMETVHKLGEKLSCEICGYVTTNKYTLQSHMKTHSDERPYECPHCGKTFKHKEMLKRCQRRCTGEGLFECPTCGRKFCDKQRMKEHELLHEGIRPHACPICKVAYTRKGNMKDHVKRVHKKNLADVLVDVGLHTTRNAKVLGTMQN